MATQAIPSAGSMVSPPHLGYSSSGRKSFLRRRATRWVAAAVLFALAISAGWIAYAYYEISHNLFAAGPLPAVNPASWSKLKVGMTQAQVAALLGRSRYQAGRATTTVKGITIQIVPEYWEYNWTDGLEIFGPSAKAYVVYFDNAGRVSRWRSPVSVPTLQKPPAIGSVTLTAYSSSAPPSGRASAP
jgi:hypothetical protein